MLLCFFLILSVSVFAQTDQKSGRKESNTERIANKIIIGDAYPNPASNEVTIDYALGKDVKEAKITIFNVLGAALQEVDLSRKELKAEISVAGLNPGLYFYTLSIDGVNELTKRLVIRR